MQVDRNRSRVQLRVEELRPLVVAAAARTVPPEHRAAWEAADIVVDGVLDPVVVGAATLALDPHRAVLLERSDGRTLSRVHVGWARDGRAAITEQGPDGQLAITASHLALLPALVMQILRLHPGIPAPRERRAITTTAAAIDRHLLDVAARGHATGDELGALLTHWSGAWRATGSWQDRPADRSVTAVNAGPLGLWTLDRRDDAGTSTPDSPVRLLPADPSAVIAVLGDVVTGRRSPRPATPATVPG